MRPPRARSRRDAAAFTSSPVAERACPHDRPRRDVATSASTAAAGRNLRVLAGRSGLRPVVERGCPPVSSAAGRRPPPPSSVTGRDLRMVVRGGMQRPSRGGTTASASLVRDGTRPPRGCPRRDAAAFTYRDATRLLRRLVHNATGAMRRLCRLVCGATPIVLLVERHVTRTRPPPQAPRLSSRQRGRELVSAGGEKRGPTEPKEGRQNLVDWRKQVGGGWRLVLCVGAVNGGGEGADRRALLRQGQGRGRHRVKTGL